MEGLHVILFILAFVLPLAVVAAAVQIEDEIWKARDETIASVRMLLEEHEQAHSSTAQTVSRKTKQEKQAAPGPRLKIPRVREREDVT
jgi:outer membrane lipoprotein-sorting protein